MKTKIGIFVLALCTSFLAVQAQRRVVTTTRATSYDISDNLDLDAVASIFGDSENLEDFEYRLNNPDNRISNLDLNQDGYIDYLRVLENSSDRNSLVVIQAVLDKDVFQDVATIEIERISNNRHRIQVVGDTYIYGSNYIIEPVFVRPPLIFSFFWGPRYSPWHSPYYWNYYPRWYSHCRPYSPFKYHKHIHVHINRYNVYNRVNERHIHFSGDNFNHIRRSDYANRYPDRTFTNRNHGLSNHNELIEKRPHNDVSRRRDNGVQRSNDRQFNENKKYNLDRPERRRNANGNLHEKSGQAPGREYHRSSDRDRQEYNSKREQRRVETYDRRPETKGNREPAAERSARRIESNRESTAPRERSGNSSARSRSANEVRRSDRNVEKSEPAKKEENAGSESRRRR